MPDDAFAVTLLIALERAGIQATPRQAREVGEQLAKVYPDFVKPRPKDRAEWRKWTDEEYATVKRMWLAGHSRAEIGAEVGRTRGAINGAITRLGLYVSKAE